MVVKTTPAHHDSSPLSAEDKSSMEAGPEKSRSPRIRQSFYEVARHKELFPEKIHSQESKALTTRRANHSHIRRPSLRKHKSRTRKCESSSQRITLWPQTLHG